MSMMIPKSVLTRVQARSQQAPRWDAAPSTQDRVSCAAPQPPATEAELQRARGMAATLAALRAMPKPM